ncbi:response regulator [bacterium]|nr:response regulator [bacterium]
MTDRPDTDTMPRVLIVDDNASYRDAFRRNLLLQGYEVAEAANMDEALAQLGEHAADVVVTDLSMRHPTEGLDLIRQARSINPHLPIIMISAVGTFEEGAEASRLGARTVISKSKIDEEMDNLFRAIDQAWAEYRRSLEMAGQIAQLRLQGETDAARAVEGLRQIVMKSDTPASIKSEAYDALSELSAPDFIQRSRSDMDRARAEIAGREIFEKVDRNLADAVTIWNDLEQQTREALRTAEFLYVHGEQLESGVDFSRSIGFSYCFAIENEVKYRLRKKFQKFFGDPKTLDLVHSLLEQNRKSISLFYHQYLLRVQREHTFDITIDNVYQTLMRLTEHQGRYKPDGLKALGIVLLCFGRSYSFRKFNQEVAVRNPLDLHGIEDAEMIRFARLLTNLQHYRNPYIHPEISEMEKLSNIRQTSFDCLNIMARIE